MPVPVRVGLALGSGGARGYAHIGVIQVLEERGYDVVGIAGTSMGALVGGLYAAGKLAPYTEWVSGLTQRDVLRLLDPSLKAPGAIRADKILARVGELLGDATIEELPIPYTAVATDLFARKEVWFQHGPLHAAIRAAIALPTFITPVMINGRLLVDGGLMNPIPLAPLTATTPDVTIGVSLAGVPDGPSSRAPVRESAEARPPEEWLPRFRRSASAVLDRDLVRLITSRFAGARSGTSQNGAGGEAPEGTPDEAAEEVFDTLPPGLRMHDVMELSLDAMQSVMTRYRLAGYPPDLLISVPKSACRTLDFHKATEMIALGRELAESALDRGALPANE